MLNRIPAVAFAVALAALSGPAFADDAAQGMSHDTMKNSATSSADSMKHSDPMSHGAMDANGMSQDTMSHDTMGTTTKTDDMAPTGSMTHSTQQKSQ